MSPLYFRARHGYHVERFLERTVQNQNHTDYPVTTVSCAGNAFQNRSILPSINLEIRGHRHPFFAGKQRLVDTAGRVERFRRRYATTPGPKGV